METERECLSFLLDLPSPPEASRLCKFLLPTVTGGQNLSCLETTQIIFRVWKPWTSLDFGRIVFLLEALGENPVSLLTQVLKNSVAVACRAKVFVSLLALGRGCPWLLSAFLHMALHLRSSGGRLGSSRAWTLTSSVVSLLSSFSVPSLLGFSQRTFSAFKGSCDRIGHTQAIQNHLPPQGLIPSTQSLFLSKGNIFIASGN